jgi:inosine-uridine nucleoside N-ribohydrolase
VAAARTRIVIDTDPGQDAAVAILLALAERGQLDLLGITSVAGNVPVPLTTANALRILELAGREDVPVFQGASQPLEAGKPTLRLETVLRVIEALGGEINLGGLPSAANEDNRHDA